MKGKENNAWLIHCSFLVTFLNAGGQDRITAS